MENTILPVRDYLPKSPRDQSHFSNQFP